MKKYNICHFCGKLIEWDSELIKVRQSGKYGKTHTYHEKCIDRKRSINRNDKHLTIN